MGLHHAALEDHGSLDLPFRRHDAEPGQHVLEGLLGEDLLCEFTQGSGSCRCRFLAHHLRNVLAILSVNPLDVTPEREKGCDDGTNAGAKDEVEVFV